MTISAQKAVGPFLRHKVLVGVRTDLLDPNNLSCMPEGDPKMEGDATVSDGLPPSGAPVAQTAAVKLSYRFAAGWKYIRIAQKSASPFVLRPNELEMWLFGDGQGCIARLRFVDSTGQTFQPDGPKIDWKGWRCITFPMTSTKERPLPHWGGSKRRRDPLSHSHGCCFSSG